MTRSVAARNRRIAAAVVLCVAVAGIIYLTLWKRVAEFTRALGSMPVPIPADNPLSDEKVILGRRLFYDRRLSFNNTIACSDCHRQEHAFSDARTYSVGATGELTVRHAMSLTNVAYNARYTWADNTLKTLEQQALIPLTGRHPLEMGLHQDESGIMRRLGDDGEYARLFASAFPREVEPFHLVNVVRAISSFVRTLISFDAPYDRYLRGERTALSESAQRGFALFRSSKTQCSRCHDGFNFRQTPGHRTNEGDDSVAYHNTGLYNIGGDGSYPARDRGLIDVTRAAADMGKFKAPTLRNVAVSAPYMHDGSMATLDAVIDHYAAGGRVIEAGPDAGDGRASPYKSHLITGFTITAQEKADLIEFLRSLTDQTFLTNPAFASPFLPTP